ncbi:MAG: ArsR/SmtB family transcription factor [Desulfitobacteriaceae bacterium]
MNNDYRKYNEIAEILKVLAHPIRLCIVINLLEQGECNVSHMHTCLEVPQSTVSQHLQKLRLAGIIEGQRNGLEINYKLKNERLIKLINSILKLSE